jgi:nucleoside-diphosphate-sugar epimerase
MYQNTFDFIQEQFKTKAFIPLHAPVFNGNEKKYVLETLESTFVSSVGAYDDLSEKMIVDEILKNIPSGKVRFGQNGSDPRNYKVSFNKVKSKLGFEPQFTVEYGVKVLVEALKIGIYSNSMLQKEKYGNYIINY